MSGPVDISPWGLAGAAALLVLNGALSVWLGLGLARRLLVAGIRTVVQLLVLGYLLVPVFAWERPILVVGLCLLMVVLAGHEAVRRVSRSYRGIWLTTFSTLVVATTTTAVLGVGVFVGVEPWWQPRYLIPIVGMILGNGLTGISLGLDRFLTTLDDKRREVEALLCFGATRWEAARPVVADSVRTGLIPIINMMSVVGVVSIPGMMTGQILGGSAPDVAARYQILIMFLIGAATAIGTVGAVVASVFVCFDEAHRLRVDRLNR